MKRWWDFFPAIFYRFLVLPSVNLFICPLLRISYGFFSLSEMLFFMLDFSACYYMEKKKSQLFFEYLTPFIQVPSLYQRSFALSRSEEREARFSSPKVSLRESARDLW